MKKYALAALLAASLASPAIADHADAGSPPSSIKGQFAGSYTCQDGEHGIYLELNSESVGAGVAQVSGVLSFFPTLAGKDGPVGMVNGSFEVSGTITQDDMSISLAPGEWLFEPAGYGAASLEGTFTETSEGLSQIIGKPAIPGNRDYCSDLILTELVLEAGE